MTFDPVGTTMNYQSQGGEGTKKFYSDHLFHGFGVDTRHNLTVAGGHDGLEQFDDIPFLRIGSIQRCMLSQRVTWCVAGFVAGNYKNFVGYAIPGFYRSPHK